MPGAQARGAVANEQLVIRHELARLLLALEQDPQLELIVLGTDARLQPAYPEHPTARVWVLIARRPAAPAGEELLRPFQLPALPPLEYSAELTCREREVLALMAHGLTNTQIGARLAISRATAKAHVSSILSKLGAASRTEAVARAVQHELTNGPR